MSFAEFADWVRSEFRYRLPFIASAASHSQPAIFGRILDLEAIGSGNHRRYGRQHQRRFRTYWTWRQIMGSQPGVPPILLDLAETVTGGYVCSSAGRSWWQADPPEFSPHRGVGLVIIPIVD